MLSDEGTMILSIPASAEITLVFFSYGHTKEIMIWGSRLPRLGKSKL